MINKPLFFLRLLIIDRALHCNQTTLWYQVTFALQTDQCVICLLNVFNSGTHTESGVGCELTTVSNKHCICLFNLRLCAVIPDSEQQIPPVHYRPLNGFPLWRWKRCLFWRYQSHPSQHPPKHLSPMSLHSMLEWFIYPKSQQLHSLLPRQHIISVTLHNHSIINKTFFQWYWPHDLWKVNTVCAERMHFILFPL